jgi:hypothetical protein
LARNEPRSRHRRVKFMKSVLCALCVSVASLTLAAEPSLPPPVPRMRRWRILAGGWAQPGRGRLERLLRTRSRFMARGAGGGAHRLPFCAGVLRAPERQRTRVRQMPPSHWPSSATRATERGARAADPRRSCGRGRRALGRGAARGRGPGAGAPLLSVTPAARPHHRARRRSGNASDPGWCCGLFALARLKDSTAATTVLPTAAARASTGGPPPDCHAP